MLTDAVKAATYGIEIKSGLVLGILIYKHGCVRFGVSGNPIPKLKKRFGLAQALVYGY